MPKVESYQKVKKEPGVGQRPANSKSLGAGIGRRPDKCDAGFLLPTAEQNSSPLIAFFFVLCGAIFALGNSLFPNQYCLDGTVTENAVKPCNCKNTFIRVHLSL